MKLKPAQLATDLERGIRPVYLVCGDEPLLVDEAAAVIRAALKARGAERTAVDAGAQFRWAEWFGQFDGLSLFATQRLLEVRLPGGKPGVEGGKVLDAWAADPAPDCALLLLLPRADKTMQNSKWFSALDNAGAVILATPPTPEQLPAWMGERLARYGFKAGGETLAWLAARVEGNLLAAHQELEKLALLLEPGTLTLDAVREAVTDVARYDAADLPEALWKGDAARFIRVVDGLKAEGESPILALWLLISDLRTLYRLALAQARGENLSERMRGLRVWESRQPLFTRVLRRLDAPQLSAALVRAGGVDRTTKGLPGPGGEDGWAVLKQLGLALLHKPAPAFA